MSSLDRHAHSLQRDALVNRILHQQPVDLQALYAVSRLEGGFLNRQLRARVWPKLLGINRYSVPDYRAFIGPHRDLNQVRCDIERSLWNYPETRKWSDLLREKRRDALASMILSILCRHSKLHYFQGYHDVMSVFLLVIEDDHQACALGEAASVRFFQDCMDRNFDVVAKTMRLIMVILKVVDRRLYDHLCQAGVEPFFATSWIITWFAHDVKNVNDIARIYDALLCSHPLFCHYLSATLLIHFREKILECSCDLASLHNLIVHIPDRFGIPFEELLGATDELVALLPPVRLKVLAGEDLQRAIDAKTVQVFNRPRLGRYVQADWVLLKNMRSFKNVTKSHFVDENAGGDAASACMWIWNKEKRKKKGIARRGSGSGSANGSGDRKQVDAHAAENRENASPNIELTVLSQTGSCMSVMSGKRSTPCVTGTSAGLDNKCDMNKKSGVSDKLRCKNESKSGFRIDGEASAENTSILNPAEPISSNSRIEPSHSNREGAFSSSIYCEKEEIYPTYVEAQAIVHADGDSDVTDPDAFLPNGDGGRARRRSIDKAYVARRMEDSSMLYSLLVGTWAIAVIGGVAVMMRMMLDSRHNSGDSVHAGTH